jgi:cell division protein FtsW
MVSSPPWRGRLRVWWREVDRVLLALVIALMVIGTIAVAAASPASARRLSTASEQLPDLYFFWRHIVWQVLSLATLLAVSFLDKDSARRLGILLAAGMAACLFLVPIFGTEVNGARRWIELGIRFQPSEFLKPGFAVFAAWLLSWRLRDPGLPMASLVGGCVAVIVALLLLQPNFGAAMLFCGVYFVLLLLSGVPLQRVGWFVGGIAALVGMVYVFYDNARHRIDAFLGGGTAFDQVDLAQRTLLAGGYTGSGFWLGTRKFNLPEAHTDYIFSVIGEEFGLIACLIVVLLYLAIVIRVLVRMVEEDDFFTLLACSALAAGVAGQAFINILVNLKLFPSKGMTLPLVSYGGSSTLAIAIGFGLLLALSRRNPFLKRRPRTLSGGGGHVGIRRS